MTRSMRSRRVRVAVVAAAVLLLGAASTAQGVAGRSSAAQEHGRHDHDRHHDHRVVLEGSGGGTLSLPGFEGDRVSFRLLASAPADRPWEPNGSFAVSHVGTDGTVEAAFAGTVDCLMAGGDVALATGVITSGGAPGLPEPPDLIGRRVGFSVADDGRRDHLGWSWLVHQFHDVPFCTGVAPFFPVTTGDFAVRGPDSFGPDR